MQLSFGAAVALFIIGLLLIIGSMALLYYGIRWLRGSVGLKRKDVLYFHGDATPLWRFLLNLLFFGGAFVLFIAGIILASSTPPYFVG
ncbi:hypothetical protein [[Mycoplasma] testudinis]|uniref:hypothetical protein n=1 Tax=[Mycoplasma] testudinis TaxID=33924 RepID=UPI00048A0297|nr:hypothetical protein [[Mycoplasma] testudinis]